MELDSHLMALRAKRDKYNDEYKFKTEIYFKNFKPGGGVGGSFKRMTDELFVMSATLFGLDEQIIAIENNVCTQDKINFVNNMDEFQLDNDVVETIFERQDHNLLMAKVGADRLGASTASAPIEAMALRNAKRFTSVLTQFVNKRNVYRKTNNTRLLDELLLLKSIMIKHFCVLEKLTDYKFKQAIV
ncbi:PK interacting protein [Orgyia leucostigma nucleopolyhedrovirus]|uniref:PK interacting protein n=1 Tax=Orgyia leucostigma nucleopolyhedrovirus TaxID=490711 RepID=B0FDY1_9ABAC|nr:PK interacting protein [Orgyia leucostigma nucleopolyhedrovirus]ABY65839.1 PK interacting protein [Orgyia leucostigma nucleopolyhedrovirus]